MIMKMKDFFRHSNLLNLICIAVFSFAGFPILAQETSDNGSREAKKHMGEAQEALEAEDFAAAEAYYRKAIAKDPSNAAAKYNLGNLYHQEERPKEAVKRLSQAAEVSTEKSIKYRSFHNKGNSLMKQKKYSEAIEAYKNALRNNPDDEETRYNLALAKEKWEEEQKNGGGESNEENEGEKKNQDQEGDQGKQDQNENGEPQDQEGGDQDKQQEKPSEEGNNKKEGGEDQKKQDPKEGEGKEPQPQQQQPTPGQLSPQQIKSLLEAMGNEEKKVQEKMNAEKVKGTPAKAEKDW